MRFLRNNGLSLVMFGMFAIMLMGHSCSGHIEHNNNLAERGQSAISYVSYLGSGAFVESVFENWESEFLQMAAYVLLTIWLRQLGSPESKKFGVKEPEEEDPRDHANDPKASWPVRRGGIILVLYENSLSITLLSLFAASFVLHAYGGMRDINENLLYQGKHVISIFDYMSSAKCWFESFQNWQSEFLSVGVLVVLQIFLRQKGSPESKPVAESNSYTGHG